MKKTKTNPSLYEDRLAVLANIERAVSEGDSFRCVELHDPEVTDEGRKRVVIPFDLLRRKIRNRIKAHIACAIADREAKRLEPSVEIRGIENAIFLKGGAVLTSNHYGPTDSLPVRILKNRCGRERELYIVVRENNVFMKGMAGFIMRNCNTLPLSASPSYMARRLKPAIGEVLTKGHFLLIYPEEQMWFNYRRPRELRDGAYYYAASFGVPVLPTFTALFPYGERGKDGFYPLKRVLEVMPPIYPDPSLSVRENVFLMKKRDGELKKECYKAFYSEETAEDFSLERDIAGFANL